MELNNDLLRMVEAAVFIAVILIAGLFSVTMMSALVFKNINDEIVVQVHNSNNYEVKADVISLVIDNTTAYQPLQVLGVYDSYGDPIPYAVNIPALDREYELVAGAWVSGSYPFKYTNTTPAGAWYDLSYDDSNWTSATMPTNALADAMWIRMKFYTPGDIQYINGYEYKVKKVLLLVARWGMPLTVYFDGQLLDQLPKQVYVTLPIGTNNEIYIAENVYFKDITQYIKFNSDNLLAYFINLTDITQNNYTLITSGFDVIQAAIVYVLEPTYTDHTHLYIYLQNLAPGATTKIIVDVARGTSVQVYNGLFNKAPYTFFTDFDSLAPFNTTFNTASDFEVLDGFLYHNNYGARGNLPVIFSWTYNWSNTGILLQSYYIPLLTDANYDVTYRLGYYKSYSDIPILDVNVSDVRYLNEHVFNSYDYYGHGYMLVFSNTYNVSISLPIGVSFMYYPSEIRWLNRHGYQEMTVTPLGVQSYTNETTGDSYGDLFNTLILDVKGRGLIDYVALYPYDPGVSVTGTVFVPSQGKALVSNIYSMAGAIVTTIFLVVIIVLLMGVVKKIGALSSYNIFD